MATQARTIELRFADVFDAFGEDRLRAHMAERRLLHLRAPLKGDPRSLLSRADLEAMIDGGHYPAELLRMYAKRKRMPLEPLNLASAGMVTPGALRAIVGKPISFVFLRLEAYVAALGPFAAEAERLLRDPVHISAVLSLSEETGVDRHYDRQGVIVIQVEGSKTWRFYGEPVACSSRVSDPARLAPDAAPDLEITLEPGDLLFVPSGQVHDCAPAGRSLHFGVLMRHMNGLTVAETLTRQIEAEDLLATPIPALLGDEHGAEQHRAIKHRIAELVAQLDIDALRTGRMAGGDG